MAQDSSQQRSPVEGAIRNPGAPNHFMVIKPIDQRLRIYSGETLLADTTSALRVIEIGKTAYHPVVYIPAAALQVSLSPSDKTTHCPLKGDASYFSFEGEEISWSYTSAFEFADALSDHHAFWASKVRIVEGE